MSGGGGLAGHRNSFSTATRCGNWLEDSYGARQAASIPARHHAALWEVPTHARDYPPPVGPPVTVAPPPNPIDALDGHLVMAHGTDILARAPESGHYMSIANGASAGITPQVMLNVHAHPTTGVRTDLMRAKAHLVRRSIRFKGPAALSKISPSPHKNDALFVLPSARGGAREIGPDGTLQRREFPRHCAHRVNTNERRRPRPRRNKGAVVCQLGRARVKRCSRVRHASICGLLNARQHLLSDVQKRLPSVNVSSSLKLRFFIGAVLPHAYRQASCTARRRGRVPPSERDSRQLRRRGR